MSDAFRMRGLDMTRIETFTDAAFAFALTLLVVSLDPPMSFAELDTMLRDVPSFVLSATLLMMFWWGHHEWSRRYGLDDGPTIVLSCLLVFTVLVYVYPLRFVFGLLTEWLTRLTGVPLASGRLSIQGPADVNAAFAVYGAGFIAMAAAIALLYLHAWRQRDVLELSAYERHVTVSSAGIWLILAGTGLLSMLLALLLPETLAGVPGWAYMLLPVAMPLYSRAADRRGQRILRSSTPAESGA